MRPSEGIPEPSRGDVGVIGPHTMCGPVTPVLTVVDTRKVPGLPGGPFFHPLLPQFFCRLSLSDVMPSKTSAAEPPSSPQGCGPCMGEIPLRLAAGTRRHFQRASFFRSAEDVSASSSGVRLCSLESGQNCVLLHSIRKGHARATPNIGAWPSNKK